jgi:hypothetical protein
LVRFTERILAGSASAEEVAPVEEVAAAPQGEEDKNAAEGREVVAGDLPKEDAPEEEEEENDDDVLLDVVRGNESIESVFSIANGPTSCVQEDSELVPTSPQVGEGDDDWDAWE